MMTEDEARQRWCPFARAADITDTMSVNRVVGEYDKQGNETVELFGRHRCIASDCMAWRPRNEFDRGEGGFCGLAGKP